MPFVALVMNLKPEAADRSLEEELAMDATAASWLPYEMLATLKTDLRAALQRSLERGLLTLAIIKQGRGEWSLRVTALGEEGFLSLSMLLQAFAICLGFLGWVAYECRSETTDCVAALTALARFAFFSGVGHYTSCGMGATRVTIGT